MPATATITLNRPAFSLADVITPAAFNAVTLTGATVTLAGVLAADGSVAATGTQTFQNLGVSGTLGVTGATTLGNVTINGALGLDVNGPLAAYAVTTANYLHVGGDDNLNNGPTTKVRRLYARCVRCTVPALNAGGAAWYSIGPASPNFEKFNQASGTALDAAAWAAASYRIVRSYNTDGKENTAGTNQDVFLATCNDSRFEVEGRSGPSNAALLQLRNISGGGITAGTLVDVKFVMLSPYDIL